MRDRNAENFIDAALECSVLVSPRSFGLTWAELMEAGTRHSLRRGEMSDALSALQSNRQTDDGQRFLPKSDFTRADFHTREEPDYRNIEAFDTVIRVLDDLERDNGKSTRIARSILVERVAQQGIERHDVDVAISVLVLCGRLEEGGGEVWCPNGAASYAAPKDQRKQTDFRRPRPLIAAAFPIVQDIVARRQDGRPVAADPLDAFSERLAALQLGQFRMWWNQTVAELRQQAPTRSPTAMTVLCAALVEGALAFVVKHARDRKLPVFASSDFSRSAKTWKIDDLVKSAASGQKFAILDLSAKNRVDALISARQRIHAGRMLDDFPDGVPDLKPEEARDALATAELTVRRVLDWLERYPPSMEPIDRG